MKLPVRTAVLSGGVEDEFRRSWREGLQDRVRQLLVREERQEVDLEIFYLDPGDGVERPTWSDLPVHLRAGCVSSDQYAGRP